MRRVTTRFPIRLPAADCRSEDFLVGPIVPNRPQATPAFVREAMDNARSSDGNEGVKKKSQSVAAATVILRGLWYNINAENFRFGFGRLRRFEDERGPRSFSIGKSGRDTTGAGEMKFLNEKSGNHLSHVPIVSGGLRRAALKGWEVASSTRRGSHPGSFP